MVLLFSPHYLRTPKNIIWNSLAMLMCEPFFLMHASSTTLTLWAFAKSSVHSRSLPTTCKYFMTPSDLCLSISSEQCIFPG